MIAPTTIQQHVASAYSVSLKQMLSQTRRYPVVLPRHIAMLLTRRLRPDYTLKELATLFHRQNHATILKAIHSLEARLYYDKELALKVARLERELSSLRKKSLDQTASVVR